MPTFPSSRPAAVVTLALLSASLLGGCAEKLEVYRTQGVKLYNEKQYDASLQAFDKALDHGEFDAVSNAYAGLLYYRANDLEQASYHFKVALQSDPSSEMAKDGLTATLIKLGKPDLALDALERSAALAEKVNDPRWKRTDIKKPYTDQIQENLYTHKMDDRIRIGRAYEQLGDYDNAVLYYQKAIDLTPKNVPALMAMANLYEKLGNKAQTRAYLARAFDIDPATPGLTDALTRNGISVSDIIGSGSSATLVPAPASAN